MSDTVNVFDSFLENEFREGMALAEESDFLTLLPIQGSPPSTYIAHFTCKGLIRTEDGTVQENERWDVGIRFPESYLRQGSISPTQVVSWLSPENVWHPNIHGPGRAICLGQMRPGTGLVELLYQIYDIISYTNLTMREDDCLNQEACAWARQNIDRFPIEKRPIKRRALNLSINID